jgi:hypothetical protein
MNWGNRSNQKRKVFCDLEGLKCDVSKVYDTKFIGLNSKVVLVCQNELVRAHLSFAHICSFRAHSFVLCTFVRFTHISLFAHMCLF